MRLNLSVLVLKFVVILYVIFWYWSNINILIMIMIKNLFFKDFIKFWEYKIGIWYINVSIY